MGGVGALIVDGEHIPENVAPFAKDSFPWQRGFLGHRFVAIPWQIQLNGFVSAFLDEVLPRFQPSPELICAYGHH